MASLLDILANGKRIANHRPWPRVVVDAEEWIAAAARLADGSWSLTSLWADETSVHMAVLDNVGGDFGVLSLDCAGGGFPSVAQVHAPATRLERSINDLFGHVPVGLPDTRPWLDHGKWGLRHPLGAKSKSSAAGLYALLPVEGENLHRIPVGPVHAGIIEPGYFHFTASGETVVRLEERLGYVHKGIDALLMGSDLGSAIRLAARVSGDSTVAYAFAFARAAEAALGITPPPRSTYLRALMAELERIANHFGDFGAICNDASFSIMHAQCGVLRERVLRASSAAFGHRLMRDCIVVAGVAGDLDASGRAALSEMLDEISHRFPALIELYDKTASLLDRTVGTGIVTSPLAQSYAAGGYIGRASGRSFDARRAPGYPPYDRLDFDVPVLTAGDVNARIWIRIREIEQGLRLIRQLLGEMPGGATLEKCELPTGSTVEGVALAEAFRGDVLVWLRLGADGRVLRCHLRDASWFQWPLLEAAIKDNIVADFPLCNKSFNCSYSGHDL